jgi:hypothetical protein
MVSIQAPRIALHRSMINFQPVGKAIPICSQAVPVSANGPIWLGGSHSL